MSTPQSIIHICSGVSLNPSYEHTIYFNDSASQLAYFAGKVVKTFSAYTFLRKTWDIKVEATMVQAFSWSYLYFNNYNSKTYFYFINNVEYISDTTVKLSLELDVMQTYMFNYELLPSFVEREHADSDEVGENTLDEGLETGELLHSGVTNIHLGELCMLFLATYDPMTTNETYTDSIVAARYNGVYSGLGLFAVNMDDFVAWGAKLKLLDEAGKSEGIVAMWMYPKTLVTLKEGDGWDSLNVCHRVTTVAPFETDVVQSTTLNGYVPRNKKLLTYPFNFLYVSDNTGGGAVYRYERSNIDGRIKFKVTGALSPEGVVKMYPLDYNNTAKNYDEGLTVSGFPVCAWNSDVYKLWLAQNQNQLRNSEVNAYIQTGVGLVSMVGGAVTGNIKVAGAGAGAMIHGATQINGLMAQKKDKAIQPPQSKGSFSASVNVVEGYQTFTAHNKTLDRYHARIIDDYFSMYGYKTHRVKVPNRAVRKNWTYTKTVDCHIKSNICTEDTVKIESIYNKGITFWMDGNNVGNYVKDADGVLDNPII